MRRIFFVLMILMIGAIFFFAEETAVAVKVVNQNLRYFGFYSHPVLGEFEKQKLDEYSAFSNVYIELGTNDLSKKLDYVGSLDMQASVSLMLVFFEKTSVGEWKLRDDYYERWGEIVPNIVDQKHLIHSFYLIDEPIVHGVSNEELKIAADIVKSFFPDVPLLIVESGLYLGQLEIPSSVDLIGMDLYGYRPSSDYYYQKIEYLKTKMANHQKLIIIADGWWDPMLHGRTGLTTEDMDEIAIEYFQFANSEPLVIGIFVFLWNANEWTNEGVLGTRDMIKVSNVYTGIGCAITSKCQNTGTIIHKVTLDGVDWVGSINIQCSLNDEIIGPVQETQVPYSAYRRPPGKRSCMYISGGPRQGFFLGVDMIESSEGEWSIMFTYIFQTYQYN